MKSYIESKVKVEEAARRLSVFPTAQEVIVKRRLQEDYCSKEAACLRRPEADDAQSTVEGAVLFIGCLEDEEKEDVLSRLHDGDAKEREEAISRLREE
jgi:hypothetical protein